jgi:uncharacterized protein YmfQ (DUF2313 family)
MGLSVQDYLHSLQASLPKGKAWARDALARTTQLLTAWAIEFARVDQRLDEAMNEADPRTTIEKIEDWELFAGLPDVCVTVDQTLEQRRNALSSKLLMQGDQSILYYINIAENMGYVGATIDEYEPFRAGISECGDSLWTEDDRFTWVLNLPSNTAVNYFSAGESAAGDPLQSWGDEPIECRINRFKPAHTTAVFAYV